MHQGSIDGSIDDALEAVAGFWRWWRRELASFLPTGPGERLSPNADVFLELSGGLLSGDPGKSDAAIGAATIGIVPDGDLFRIRKSFPKAVKKNLWEAISLQVEQLVPLERGAIHFGYRVLANAKTPDRVDTEIVIVEKERLDRMVAWAGENGVPLETIRAAAGQGADEQGEGAGLVLWESDLLARKRRARRMNGLLGVLLLILVGSASSALGARWQTVEESWMELVHQEQLRAVDARTLKEEIRAVQEREIAGETLRTAGDIRQALAILTEVVPDSAHASRVKISGDSFRLDLTSRDSAALEKALAADGRLSNVAVEGVSEGAVEGESSQVIAVTGVLAR